MGNCWSRLTFMGDCWPRFLSSESMSPRHCDSTPASHLTIEPSEPSSQDSVDPLPSMERSQRSPLDSVRASAPVEPFQRSSVDSVRPSPIDAIESIREMYEKVNTVEQTDRLVSFVENHLEKLNTPSEVGSSSSDGWLETVGNCIKIAAETIDTICTEADKLSNSNAVKAMGGVTLKVLEGAGDLHWACIGLSVAAYAVENHLRVFCKENECREILRNILELAKEVNECNKRMSYEREKLCNAVGTIVEGAVILCYYLGNTSRFWSATTAAAQFKKTNQQLRNARDSLDLSSIQQILDIQWRKDYGGDKDVFLSHSGTQKNFVRQLYKDLAREHVSCFFDEDHNSLPLAQRFPPLIFKACETCKIAVVLLSKEFVRSKWPMLELSAFIRAMNSGKNPNLKLLPIFFMITPKEIQDRPEWANLGVTNDTRYEWYVALKVVRSINGLFFGESGDEVQLRDKVVKEICRLLNRINPPQLLEFEPVGIEEQVREVKKLLNMEGTQSALAVIVYGLGGIGKSTVAASVVHSLDWSSTDFKFCRVAIDQETPNKTSHIIELQKYIIYKLGGFKLDFQDPLEGRIEIKKALQKKCSLLLIDNVVDKDYIRDLLPRDLHSSHQETKLRIIITSREKNVKTELKIICNEYEVKGLSDGDSQRLLADTIVEGQIIEDEKGMIYEVALACRGVPLLLSVFGKHLRVERNKEEALYVLRKGNLDTYRDEDLSTKLMFVYDKIKDTEVKEAFLDICTYFHGWEWNLVADIVDYFKLEDLRRRTLVSKSDSGKVIVHDILRLMGMKEARFTRFLNYKEFSDALEENLDGFRNVKGISIVNDNCFIKITQLEAMGRFLRVLMLGDWVILDGCPSHKAFTNLRYLSVGDIATFPFKDPSKLEKLRVLENRSNPGMNLSYLPSGLKHISHEVPDVECDECARLPLENLSSLKCLFVKKRKSVKLPEELHLPASLVNLHLIKCKNLPKDIGHLSALESLILDTSDMECLPQGYGKLQKLKHLSLNYCSKLVFLSEELAMLSSLEALSMKDCGNLRVFPISLGALYSLQTLELRGCINLQLLPESFGELRIRSLKLHSLVNLEKLPNSFGNMPLLKDLSLISCHSLMSLPNSFVQLKMLETLEIYKCTKLSFLPEDFGQLGYLEEMTVTDCHVLRELPHGFGALPALKKFELQNCDSFVNLPRDFTELKLLEKLRLERLPLLSRIPDGCAKLKKLRSLFVDSCFQLKTLPDGFESIATLENLSICNCPELDEAMLDKILKLQNCYAAHIAGSRKLVEKWKHMQSQPKHLIAVFCEKYMSQENEENVEHAIGLAFLHGKFKEVNNLTDQLSERSSLFAELEEGTIVTVALIMLPINIALYQHQIVEQFVEMAKEEAKTNGSRKMQIVCATKYDNTVQRPTPTVEEERADDEAIRQILLLLPKGSCFIPSSEKKRVQILSKFCDSYDFYYMVSCFMGDVVVDMEGSKSFENMKFIREYEIRKDLKISNPENEQYKSIQSYVESICGDSDRGTNDQSETTARQSKTREFIEVLKGSGIHYLLIENNTNKMMVEDLDGKTIGFIICGIRQLECINLRHIYQDLQQNDSNFIAIWIPTLWPEDCGHGTYTRVIQGIPWATFPDPQLVYVESRDRPCLVVLDKQGEIAEFDALNLLLAWGVKSHPFTEHTIPESFSSMLSESCLEFLLHGMNIDGRKAMKSKMTFVFSESPSEWHEMKSQLEQLIQIHGNFEVLYVGKVGSDLFPYNIESFKEVYEDAIQYMHWPALSFSDMVMFWLRCRYLASKEAYELNKEWNRMMETVQGLARQLRARRTTLVLVDNDGPVTCIAEDVRQMICESGDEILGGERMVKDELKMSLDRGECSLIVRTIFRDEIDNHPQHPRHRISYSAWRDHCTEHHLSYYTCHVCFSVKSVSYGKRSYRCNECEWWMCRNCWLACAKQQVESVLLAKNS